MITLQQVYWAMEHDWYYYTGTRQCDGVNVVYVYDDFVKGSTLSFTDYDELRAWAGY